MFFLHINYFFKANYKLPNFSPKKGRDNMKTSISVYGTPYVVQVSSNFPFATYYI
ncbi:hypothetical protein FEM08_11690 [Flavobacterium gilvum]|nr:hypothetical protein FEM08_11690 [Flavobacterium gilvum]